MSFGYSVGDFVLLTQLAWRTLQNARRACGDHDVLARETGSLHVVLQRLETEMSKPHSILKSGDDDRRNELATLAGNCERVVNVLRQVLEKYNALPEEKKSVTKLWKKIRFGNGEMQDLSAIRLQLSAHTNAIALFLNLLSIGSQGDVEHYMTTQGGELRKIRDDVNWITATLQARGNAEGSTLSSYTNDDKSFWKELRRELVKEGYSSKVLRRHKTTIKNYVLELDAIGALDELPQGEPELNLEVTAESEAATEAEVMVTNVTEVEIARADVTLEHSNLEGVVEVSKAVVAKAKADEAEFDNVEVTKVEIVPEGFVAEPEVVAEPKVVADDVITKEAVAEEVVAKEVVKEVVAEVEIVAKEVVEEVGTVAELAKAEDVAKKGKKQGKNSRAFSSDASINLDDLIKPYSVEELTTDDICGTPVTKKDKKGKKNAPTEVIKDTLAELPVSPEAVEEPKLAEEDPWGSWGVAVKKGKKGKVIDPVNVESVEVQDPAVEESELAEGDSRGIRGTAVKKGKKVKVVDPTWKAFWEPVVEESKLAEEDPWGIWGAAVKKGKKGKVVDPVNAKSLVEVRDPAAKEDPWGFGRAALKKGKKGKVVDPVNVESLVEVRDPAVIFLGIIQPVAIDDSGRVEESLEVLSFDCSHLGDIKAPSASLEAGPEDVDKNSDDPRRGWSGN